MPGTEIRIRAFLDGLAARWRRLAWLRYGARVGLILGAIWAVAIAIWLAGARASLAREAWLVAAVAALTAIVCALAWRRRPLAPRGVVLARLAEERIPALEDRLVTAAGIVDGHTDASPAIRTALLADTAARLDQLPPDAVISGARLRRSAWQAAAVAAILLVTGTTLTGPTLRTAQAAWVFASPNALAFHVDPGNVRIRPNTPLVIRVQASSGIGDLVPSLVAKIGDATREERMTREGTNRFAVTFSTVPASFSYHIALAGRTSPDFQVTLLQPPRVGRIDLSYEFPSYAKLPPRSETDGGDVYAPEGTRVHMVVHPREATAHVASAELALGGDKRVPLTATPDGSLAGDLVVSSDDTYRVRLTDTDGLQNTDDPEYFVRVLDDRPPEVHIVRPAGDRQVTPLEEVEIEARADDDHGVDRLELVYGVKGRGERVVPLGGDGASLTVTGHYTIPLEQLEVSPGDFVTFYARARDIGRGKRPSEARSDIFFLEVTPFVDEFALAQSQAMAGAAGQQMDDLVRLQKDIIVGTWKVDRRSAGPRAEASPDAVRTLAKGQGTVRQKTEAAAGRAGGGGPMHASPDESSGSIGADLMAAAGSMAKAESALGGQKTAAALPFEMDALNHLLKAQSEAARKEVMRQQAGRRRIVAGAAGSVVAVRSRAAEAAADQLRDAEDRRREARRVDRPDARSRARAGATPGGALAAAGRPRARSPASRRGGDSPAAGTPHARAVGSPPRGGVAGRAAEAGRAPPGAGGPSAAERAARSGAAVGRERREEPGRDAAAGIRGHARRGEPAAARRPGVGARPERSGAPEVARRRAGLERVWPRRATQGARRHGARGAAVGDETATAERAGGDVRPSPIARMRGVASQASRSSLPGARKRLASG